MTMAESFSDFDVDALTLPQRLELITRLWDSIPEDMRGLEVPDWHREEVERRLAAADASPESAIPWKEVRRRLRGES
jgi:putative addiction module component (TIGR02574 family)